MRARTRDTYEALREIMRASGTPPTTRQLTEKMGLDVNRYLSSVYYALLELQAMGLVERRIPDSVGIYVPVPRSDPVDWETLLGGDGDEREKMEGS